MRQLAPGFCVVCGQYNNNWNILPIIPNDLAKSWHLTNVERRQFDLRESSFCSKCANSLRSRSLALAIIKQIQFPKVTTFIDWISQANKAGLKIAEINSCGKLHSYLNKINRLYYSEFNLDRGKLPFWKRWRHPKHEDITHLSYPNNRFDLVIHSEVLEHVPDYHLALKECRRILKPKGICLFTIPLLPKRKTRVCVSKKLNSDQLTYLKSPSYHGSGNKNDYLVWWEFGKDIIKKEKVKTVINDSKYLNYVFMLKK